MTRIDVHIYCPIKGYGEVGWLLSIFFLCSPLPFRLHTVVAQSLGIRLFYSKFYLSVMISPSTYHARRLSRRLDKKKVENISNQT